MHSLKVLAIIQQPESDKLAFLVPTDTQTDTQTDRQTHRQTHRQTDNDDRHTDRQTDRQTDTQTDGCYHNRITLLSTAMDT